MKKLLPLLLLAAALNVQAYTGKELLEDCQAAEASYAEKKTDNAPESVKASRCMAYVEGFADGYGVGDYLAEKVGVQLNAFCPPQGNDARYRLVRAVLAHIEKQPPNSQASTRTLVAGALSKTFPCGQ